VFLPSPRVGQEAQAYVIHGPATFRVTERRTEQIDNLIESAGALPLWKSLGKRPRKRFKPTVHVSWKDNGTRKKLDRFHSKSRGLQLCPIFLCCGKVPGVKGSSILNTVPVKHGEEGHCDGRNVPVAAEFPGEPAAGPESPPDALKDSVRVALHPMEGGVRKGGIEFSLEGKMKRVGQPGINAALLCGCHHIGRTVNANHSGPRFDDPGRKHAVTAAHIQNAFARLRIQQAKNGLAEQGDERRVLSITIGFPFLHPFVARAFFRSR